MGSINSMDREQKKRQLKRRVIRTGTEPYQSENDDYEENEEAIVHRAEKKVRQKRVRFFLFLLAILAFICLIGYQYLQNHQFTTYTTLWEKQIPSSDNGFTAYEKFGDNILKYTKDGASYIDREGNAVWSLSYGLKSPICYVNGDYAVIADQQGNAIYICDKKGCRGQATTLLPILRVSVSAYGVAAALVEDSKSSYVTFFKNDGSALDWGIKTVMEKNGYLMDVSLSPEGTQVMLSDLYLQDGILKNRIVFYNFSEFGKSYPDRLVGGFEEFADNLSPRVRFLDEEHACAFADEQIAFFSLENVTSPELVKQVPIETEIRSIAYSTKHVAVVLNTLTGENPYRLDVYKSNGDLAFSKEFDYQYQDIDIDGDFVILYNEDSCKIYSLSGRERFFGQFDFTVSKITRGAQMNSLIVTGGDTMREIKLK
ncbi:MAG: DUF5711 family protein [Clostridium sp.]